MTFLREQLGRSLHRPVVWRPTGFLQGSEPIESRFAAVASSVRCDGDDWAPTSAADAEACLVRRGPDWSSAAPHAALWAHELFHCYQYEVAGPAGRSVHLPGWVMEGAATWVGLSHDSSDASGLAHYSEFFATPKPLTDPMADREDPPNEQGEEDEDKDPPVEREYDGVAVFAALADAKVVVWDVLLPLTEDIVRRGERRPEIFLTLSTVDAVQFLLDAARGSPFSTNFATTAARRPDLGPDWEITGPGVPPVAGRQIELVFVEDRRDLRLQVDLTGDPALFRLESLPDDTRAIRLTVSNPVDHGAMMVDPEEHRFIGETSHTFCVDGPLPTPPIVAVTRWPDPDDPFGQHAPMPRIEVLMRDDTGVRSRCSRYRTPEAAMGAALAELEVAFGWPCPSYIGVVPEVKAEWYCPAGIAYTTELGVVTTARYVDDYHFYRFAFLLDPPQTEPGWQVRGLVDHPHGALPGEPDPGPNKAIQPWGDPLRDFEVQEATGEEFLTNLPFTGPELSDAAKQVIG